MSWTEVPNRRALTADRGKIILSLSRHNGDIAVRLRLTPEAREGLGVTEGGRLSISLGAGEHHGWLRLAKADEGFIVAGPGARYPGLVRLMAPRGLAHEPVPAQPPLETRWEGDALLLRLPPAFLRRTPIVTVTTETLPPKPKAGFVDDPKAARANAGRGPAWS